MIISPSNSRVQLKHLESSRSARGLPDKPLTNRFPDPVAPSTNSSARSDLSSRFSATRPLDTGSTFPSPRYVSSVPARSIHTHFPSASHDSQYSSVHRDSHFPSAHESDFPSAHESDFPSVPPHNSHIPSAYHDSLFPSTYHDHFVSAHSDNRLPPAHYDTRYASHDSHRFPSAHHGSNFSSAHSEFSSHLSHLHDRHDLYPSAPEFGSNQFGRFPVLEMHDHSRIEQGSDSSFRDPYRGGSASRHASQ
jgi:hypothetical protein